MKGLAVSTAAGFTGYLHTQTNHTVGDGGHASGPLFCHKRAQVMGYQTLCDHMMGYTYDTNQHGTRWIQRFAYTPPDQVG